MLGLALGMGSYGYGSYGYGGYGASYLPVPVHPGGAGGVGNGGFCEYHFCQIVLRLMSKESTYWVSGLEVIKKLFSCSAQQRLKLSCL